MESEEEFRLYLKNLLAEFLGDFRLQNSQKQLLARKLKTEFNHNYNFSYIWDKVNVAISAAYFLLKDNDEEKVAVQSLSFCAEICEHLTSIQDYDWDRTYALIISALCYDLAGYQSNAFCIVRNLEEYSIDQEDVLDDDEDALEKTICVNNDNEESSVIFKQIILILQKKISYANFLLKKCALLSERFDLLKSALLLWYENILNLKETEFLNKIQEAYKAYLYSDNVYLAKIIQLLDLKITISYRRSLLNVLAKNGIDTADSIWRKYLKILSNDYYQKNGVKKIEDRKSLYELWVSQRKAIEQGLFTKNQNFVVQMPTSAGKTFIAELFILNRLVNYPGKRCLYISPFRALASEKEYDFGNVLSKIGFFASSINGGFDQDVFQKVIYDHADVMVATPEKIDLLSRLDENFFDNIVAVVVDEGHIIGDISPRAALLEMLVCRIKNRKPEIPILFISAVMSKENADEYSAWLSGNKENVLRSTRFEGQEDWQPTRKIVGNIHLYKEKWRVVFKDTSFKNGVGAYDNAYINSFLEPNMYGKECPEKAKFDKREERFKTNKSSLTVALSYKLSEDGNVLVFCGTTTRLQDVARKICNLYESEDSKLPEKWLKNPEKGSYHYACEYFGPDHWISKCLLVGVGVHFGNLPEMLRKNIEQDYKKKILKVLLCTNTISQGVNLPIKYVIVHNLIIGRDHNRNKLLFHRDFKNLVGRAGRAEFETEGMIFFIVNSAYDSKLYNDYINTKTVEVANSIIFNLYSNYLQKIVREEDFLYWLSVVLDSDLIAEFESSDWNSDFKDVVEKIIKNTLFGIECSLNGLPLEPLKNGLQKCFYSIKDKSENLEMLKRFKKTGFSIDYNKKMFLFVQEHSDEFVDCNIETVLDLFLSFLQENGCSDVSREGILPQNLWVATKNVLMSWMSGTPLDIVKRDFSCISDSESDFLKFMSHGIDYLLPWLLSAFVDFFADVKKDSLSENDVKMMGCYPLFLKYGLNNKIACLARTMGIFSRDAAILLAEKSGASNDRDFIAWLIKLEKEDIDSLNLDEFDRLNVEDVAKKYNRNREPSQKIFFVKGTRYNNLFKETSLKTGCSDLITLVRDEENLYDAFAVKVVSDAYGELGYVPADMAPYYAVEMDVNEKSFSGFVSRIVPNEDYNSVEITLNRVEWVS